MGLCDNKQIEKKYGSTEEEQISDWELAIKQTNVKPKEKIIRTGLLLTAGLIAGEALTGVPVAFLIVGGINLAVFEFPPQYSRDFYCGCLLQFLCSTSH